jgi:hypothetical protein
LAGVVRRFIFESRAFPVAHFCMRYATAQAIVGEVFNMPQAAQRARYNLSQYKLSQQKNGPGAFAESIKFKVQASRKIAGLPILNFGAIRFQTMKKAAGKPSGLGN